MALSRGEVFPGHLTAVDPELGENYAKLACWACSPGVRSVDDAVRIPLSSDGLMSSFERFARGITSRGSWPLLRTSCRAELSSRS